MLLYLVFISFRVGVSLASELHVYMLNAWV